MLRRKLTISHTFFSVRVPFIGFISEFAAGAPFQMTAKISPSLEP
jgi:hypothetical protein